jgi:two-component system KDP operon response regulator KdpE
MERYCAIVCWHRTALVCNVEILMNDKPIILVVADEIQIRRFLRARFELEGFNVREARSGEEGVRSATLQPPDLVILDTDLPDMDGAEVLARLRSWSMVPVIIISVRSNETEKVRFLEEGADDYIIKPFGIAELVARSRVAMRRHARVSFSEPVVRAGALTIDLSARTVIAKGSLVNLTPKEYMLIQILAENLGKVVTHQFLLYRIWGSEHLKDSHYLRIFVRKLRRKIEEDSTQPRILLTEHGVGYRLAHADEAGPSKSI